MHVELSLGFRTNHKASLRRDTALLPIFVLFVFWVYFKD